MSSNWSRFIFNIIWVIGLIILATIDVHFEQVVHKISGATFNLMPVAWFPATASFLFGMYLSLLFVKKWSFKVNVPLLLGVSIPCFILSFYFPVAYTFVKLTTHSSTIFIPNALWLANLNHVGIASIVSGLTLVMGLFGSSQNSNN